MMTKYVCHHKCVMQDNTSAFQNIPHKTYVIQSLTLLSKQRLFCCALFANPLPKWEILFLVPHWNFAPVRSICAMPRASVLSVLFLIADRAALTWRASMQTTSKPSAVRPKKRCWLIGRFRQARNPRDVTCKIRQRNSTDQSSFQASMKANLTDFGLQRRLPLF